MREVSSFLSTVHPLIWKPRLDMCHPQGWWDLQNIVVPMVKRLIFLEMRDNIGSVALISWGQGWIRGSWTAMVMDGELIAAKKGELLQVIAASPLHTDAHSCTHMHTDAQKIHTDAHKYTQMHTNAHKRTKMHAGYCNSKCTDHLSASPLVALRKCAHHATTRTKKHLHCCDEALLSMRIPLLSILIFFRISVFS